MKFALACEGPTDFITIENILCGFYDYDDLEDNISKLQPPLDETDNKQVGSGGWGPLINYLSTTRFRDDVLNNEFLIVQIDTDVSEEIGFDVKKLDDKGIDLDDAILIDNVVARLKDAIIAGDADFFDTHMSKIIFCICVHSIECWILAHYTQKKERVPKTKGCESALFYQISKQREFQKLVIEKTYKFYDELTRPFHKRKNIFKSAEKNPSFNVFINSLEIIRAQVEA